MTSSADAPACPHRTAVRACPSATVGSDGCMTVACGEIRVRTGAADPRARCGTQADAAIVDRVIGRVHLIFYVSDQAAATAFWQAVLDCPPALDVPDDGIRPGCARSARPDAGNRIRSLLGSSLPDPAAAHGIPRAELYLVVDDAAAYHARAQAAGATELSALTRRSWGDDAAYCLDPDGHVVAFATDNRQPVADQANHRG